MPINPTPQKRIPVKNLKRQIAQQIPPHAIAIHPSFQDAQRRLQHTPPQLLPPELVPANLFFRVDEDLAALVERARFADQRLERRVDPVAVQLDVLEDGGGAEPEEVRESGEGVRPFVGDF